MQPRGPQRKVSSDADVVIELGGGGRKNPVPVRRYGGSHERLLCRRHRSFVDQMATLLNIRRTRLNRIAGKASALTASPRAAACS